MPAFFLPEQAGRVTSWPGACGKSSKSVAEWLCALHVAARLRLRYLDSAPGLKQATRRNYRMVSEMLPLAAALPGACITVAHVLQGALPEGSALMGGGGALGRRVSWAVALRLREGFGALEPNAIALLSIDLLTLMPARPTVAQTIEALGKADVAAVLLRGRLEPYQVPLTCRMAERVGCALVQLPSGKSAGLATVELAINSYLGHLRTSAPLDGSGKSER